MNTVLCHAIVYKRYMLVRAIFFPKHNKILFLFKFIVFRIFESMLTYLITVKSDHASNCASLNNKKINIISHELPLY